MEAAEITRAVFLEETETLGKRGEMDAGLLLARWHELIQLLQCGVVEKEEKET